MPFFVGQCLRKDVGSRVGLAWKMNPAAKRGCRNRLEDALRSLSIKCPCPARCKFCGRRRSRDIVGHYCKTPNCEWQHGYAVCTLHKKKSNKV